MNRDQFIGLLQQSLGVIVEYWGDATDTPTRTAAGRQAQRTGRLLAQCGLTSAQADRQLREFLYRNRHWKTDA